MSALAPSFDRHPSITRTQVTRDCPHCDGSGEVTVNDTNPHGYGPDPQCDEAVTCTECDHGVQTVWTDPLLLLAAARRFPRFPYYARAKYRAVGPSCGFSQMAMIARAIACDVSMRAVWGIAA